MFIIITVLVASSLIFMMWYLFINNAAPSSVVRTFTTLRAAHLAALRVGHSNNNISKLGEKG